MYVRVRDRPVGERRTTVKRRVAGTVVLLGIVSMFTDISSESMLTERDSLATKYFPLLYVGANFAYLALAIPFGRMADRIGRGRVFTGGPVLVLVSYLCAGGASSGPVASVACPLLLGGYYAATDGVLAAISLCPTPIRASGIATAQTAVAIARFATSLGFGLMWTELGRVHALLLVSAMPAAGIPVAAGLLPGIGTAPPDHHAPRPVAVEV